MAGSRAEFAARTATPRLDGADARMIEVEGLTKRYGETAAIEGVTFSASPGDILGFLGPNGAGKSTTMRILTCFTPPTRGTARVAGYDILREPDDVRREIGYLPESNPLYNEMSVCGYVEFLARLKGLSGARRRGAVDTALEETGLAQVRRRLIGNLSKGFRQRVGLAGALVGDPRVLILDEPTVGLDPAQIREIREMIRAMRGKRTVLLSTHILPEVSMTCNKVAIINEGRIEASGEPENLVSALEETAVARALVGGAPPETLERALREVQGVRSVRIESLTEGRCEAVIELERGREARPALARAILGAGADLYEFRVMGLTLEEVFLRLVSRSWREEAAAASPATAAAGADSPPPAAGEGR